MNHPIPYEFLLFVCGKSPTSQSAEMNARRLGETALNGVYKLTVIDILSAPDLAESISILATPTLIKQAPPPMRRVVGDLSDLKQVIQALDIERQEPWE